VRGSKLRILRFDARHRRPAAEPLNIGPDLRQFGHELPHRGPGQGRAPQHVGGAEALAEQVRSLGELGDQGFQHRIKVAIGHLRRRPRLAFERAIADRRLESRGVVDQPSQIWSAQRIADGRSEPSLRKKVRQINEDRHLLGDHRVAVLDRGHLAHRVDGEIIRPTLLPRLHIEHPQLVRRAELLEQQQRARGSCVRRMIEGDLTICAHVRLLSTRSGKHGGKAHGLWRQDRTKFGTLPLSAGQFSVTR
jgi:hypothetical protein